MSYRKLLTIELGILLLGFSAILTFMGLASAAVGGLGALAGLAAFGVAVRMK